MADKNHNGKVSAHKGVRNPNRRNGKAFKKNPKTGTKVKVNSYAQIAAHEQVMIRRHKKWAANLNKPASEVGNRLQPKREKAFPHPADNKAWDHIIANNFGRDLRA